MYRVLTVEDESLIQQSLKKIIQSRNGFLVVGEAQDGVTALQLAGELKPDLIVTDIFMPEMDGLELTQKLREAGSTAEIVIISGHGDFQYAKHALRHQAFEYWLKPVGTETILQTLERLAMKWEEKQAVETHRVWKLQACARWSESLAGKLWLLEESAIQSGLLQVRTEIDSLELSVEGSSLLYADLQTVLTQRLAEYGCLMESNFLREGNSDLDPHTDFAQWIADVMEKIRCSRTQGSDQYVNQAIQIIQSSYEDPTLSLRTVSASINLSETYLSHLFKQATGIPLTQYITQYRMQQAKQYLIDPTVKIYNIAYQVGYRDYPHFSRMFRKLLGCSPADYRKSALHRS